MAFASKLVILGAVAGAASELGSTAPWVPITKVHVIFSNHLDVGFATNCDAVPPGPGEPCEDAGLARNVVNRYFNTYFPRAAAVAQEMRDDDYDDDDDAGGGGAGGDRYIWTTQSWLVSLYRDCPPGLGLACPNATDLLAFEAAVGAGDITWHAFPFNAEMEVFDEALLRFGVDHTHALDDAYGVPRKAVLSQRDVPGMTRAALRPLTAAGVTAISVGVNGASAPPALPRAFVWRDEPSGTDMLTFYHPLGYGGIARQLRPTPHADCVVVEGHPEALCMDWRGDNWGPAESASEVRADLDAIRAEFPLAAAAAGVFASTFDAFAAGLASNGPAMAGLPVVTGEVGDTWVHGTASDPIKVRAHGDARQRKTVVLPWNPRAKL